MDWLKSAFGGTFELGHEEGDAIHRMPSANAAWNIYSTGFGPVRGVAEMLDEPRRQEMQAAFEDWMNGFGTSLGVAMKCEYLVTVGVKR